VPLREFYCKDCEIEFELLLRQDDTALCPRCGTGEVARRLSTFAAPASAAREMSQAVSACGRCGDPRGPGSCASN